MVAGAICVVLLVILAYALYEVGADTGNGGYNQWWDEEDYDAW